MPGKSRCPHHPNGRLLDCLRLTYWKSLNTTFLDACANIVVLHQLSCHPSCKHRRRKSSKFRRKNCPGLSSFGGTLQLWSKALLCPLQDWWHCHWHRFFSVTNNAIWPLYVLTIRLMHTSTGVDGFLVGFNPTVSVQRYFRDTVSIYITSTHATAYQFIQKRIGKCKTVATIFPHIGENRHHCPSEVKTSYHTEFVHF